MKFHVVTRCACLEFEFSDRDSGLKVVRDFLRELFQERVMVSQFLAYSGDTEGTTIYPLFLASRPEHVGDLIVAE